MKTIHLIIPIILFSACTIPPNQVDSSKSTEVIQPTTSVTLPTILPQASQISQTKFDPTQNVCTQITPEFVTQATGITIIRTSSINDVSINACDYYLIEDKNSPYIAVVVNKNLNYEKHKQIAIKNKMVLNTDPSITVEHFISWTDSETRISNINLKLSENSFLRIDKNVERAIDNEGMIKLASAISKTL